VLVATRRRGGQVAIEVRDNGIGIAQEHQAAIFAEFYQVGNAAREQNKGLGLGLSIVDRLAKAIDIKVSLKSRQGEGTLFTLLLNPCPAPIALPPPRNVGIPADKVDCIGNSGDLQACAELLEQWGYEVRLKASGDTGRTSRHAVVIADPDALDALCGGQTPPMPLIVLAPEAIADLPAGVHQLPLPLRPAKLRALVSQLQKALSKSMP